MTKDRGQSGRTSTVPDAEPAPVGKGSHVYLIDGSGYVFRAFHALPPLTRPSDGLPVGAVHGFCQMLWKLMGDCKATTKPTHIAVVFDAGRECFRNKIYKEYKANRKEPPEEIILQFPMIRDAVKAFNVACVELHGYEADDLIATYAKEVTADGGQVTIVSSDKDLMQLVGPGVAMLDTMKNRRIGREEVIERFGVEPEKVVDVQALAGDAIDNVPGVPGIGVKIAAELIKEYGDLDTLLQRAGEIKQPKRRQRLVEYADQARLSRELVLLNEDVPVDVALAQMGVQEPQPAALLGFLRAMEFNTLTRRIAEALDAEPPPALETSVGKSLAKPVVVDTPPATKGGPVEPGTPAAVAAFWAKEAVAVPIDRSKYESVTTLERLEAWLEEARHAGRFGFATETTSRAAMHAELVGFSLAVQPGKACYVPVGHRAASGALDFGEATMGPQAPRDEALALLKPLLEDPTLLKIGHNIKDDALALSRYGIRIKPFDDTMLLSYALDSGRTVHGMDELAERHLQHTCISFDTVIQYAPGAKKADKTFAEVPIDKATESSAEDADVTLRLWVKLKPRLVAQRMTTVYETLERPLVPVIVDMERAGIKVDQNILSRLSSQFAQSICRLEGEVYERAGYKFNLGSTRQVGELVFDRLRLPGGKKTKTGQWETRANLLDDLVANEELPEDARKLVNTMLEWRQLAKLKSTYTDALPIFIHPDTGRIHTCYALGATSTGRLASKDPNLQNIPVRSKEGRAIRTAFVPEPGMKLVSADYSQIELRLLAHIADIRALRQAFAERLDIHAMTASEMFGVPLAEMSPDVRRRAKAINFGIIYGISPFGLANQLGISREEAGAYITTYFKRFPGIRDYMECTRQRAREQGYVETIFGRRVHLPEINTRNPSMRGFLERAAINAPIQGSAADIIRRAMIRVRAALERAQLTSARMLLQVHDELVFEVEEAEVETTIATVAKVMERAPEPAVALTVPLKVDAKAGANWEAAH